MGNSRNGAEILKRAIAQRLISQFSTTGIDGITATPVITRTITANTPYPYIFVREDYSQDAYVTKDGESREHYIAVEVVYKYNPQRGTHVQLEQTANEVLRILDTAPSGYPDLTADGFNLFIFTAVNNENVDYEAKGAKYFRKILTFKAVTDDMGLAAAPTLQPVQEVSYAYSGFQFAPTTTNIEAGDSGSITPATAYPNGNNGWNFSNIITTQIINGDGTLANGVYTVAADDLVLGLNSILNYTRVGDASQTTLITDNDVFSRIRSLRYGSIAGVAGKAPTFTKDILESLPQWNTGNRSVMFGQITGAGVDITISGGAGDFMYIITDMGAPNISSIIQNVGANIEYRPRFVTSTVGAYTIYFFDSAFSYDNTTLNLTLS